jgi:hypothetical protein
MQTLEERVAEMPTFLTRPLLGVPTAFTAAAMVLCTAATGAEAKSVPIDLKVIAGDGKTLAEVRQFTGSTNVPTSPRARCFIGGVGGSGDPFQVSGATPIGALADANRSLRRLRPLLVTDEFAFGLGVCGIGGSLGTAERFWQLRVNHQAATVAGDQITVQGGDDVLWALVPNPTCDPNPPFECEPGPPELQVRAPARARPGDPFTVTVFQWSEKGTRNVAAGVSVTGAAQPTNASGVTTVELSKSAKLTARRSGSVASAPVAVCVKERLGQCDKARGRLLLGSKRADSIRGTKGGDRIKPGGGRDRVRARGGDDVIKARGGGRDRINCGGGRDRVRADRRDSLASNCERVGRR